MDATPPGEARHWQRTLRTMVGVQFVMSISFSILSPIMPLFLPELGVVSPQAVAVWAGVLASFALLVRIELAVSSQRRTGRPSQTVLRPESVREL